MEKILKQQWAPGDFPLRFTRKIRSDTVLGIPLDVASNSSSAGKAAMTTVVMVTAGPLRCGRCEIGLLLSVPTDCDNGVGIQCHSVLAP